MSDQLPRLLGRRKPFRLLKTMNKKEIDLFRHFLECPIYNYRPDHKVITFFDHCRKQKVWQREVEQSDFLLRSKLDLTDSLFDKRVSALNHQLSRFAGTVKFSQGDVNYWPLTLDFCHDKQLEFEEIENKKAEGSRKIAKGVQDAVYFKLMLEMEHAVFSPSRGQPTDARPFDSLNACLDSFFIIRKLRIMCAHANVKHVFSDQPNENLESNKFLIDWMKMRYAEMPTLARVYFHCYHVISDIYDEDHFEAFKTELTAWELETDSENRIEIQEFYLYLLNLYTAHLNTGEFSVAVKLDEIYTKSLDKGFLLTQGLISPENFKNILRARAVVGKLTEARDFFQLYKNCLTEAQEGTAIAYNEIVLNYFEKDLHSAIKKAEALMEATGAIKADEYYGISLRLILLRAYYEALAVVDLDDWDRIDEKLKLLLRAFPAYIDRRGLSAMNVLYITNFRKSVHQLYHVAYDLSPGQEQAKKAEELLLEYRSSSNLPSKSWFISEVMELIAPQN